MILDHLYAANLEELQDIVEQLTETIKCDYNERNRDKHFDPSIVQFGSMQVSICAEVNLLTDGSAVYDMRFQFHALDHCN